MNIIGWAPEATAETDPITLVGSNYYKFGLHSQEFDIPHQQVQWKPIYYNAKDPTDIVAVRSEVTNGFTFEPTNGIFWYYFMGSASGPTTRTVTGNALGTALPTFTVRTESTGGDATIFQSAVGCRVEGITQTFSIIPSGIHSTMALQVAGIRSQQAALNQAHNGTTLPSSISDVYIPTTAMTFTWNSVEFNSALIGIQFTGINTLLKGQVENQVELENITESIRKYRINFTYLRGWKNDIYTDYLAQTKRTLVFKIYQTASNYIQFTASNCAIHTHEGKINPVQNNADQPARFYTVNVVPTSISIEEKSGVADSFFGI